MKKWGWPIGGVIAALIVFSMFLPATSVTRNSRAVNCTNEALTRWTVNPTNWKAWWPGEVLNDSTIQYKGNPYHIEIILLNGFKALRADRTERIEFQFIPQLGDSSELIVTRTQAIGWNPIGRIYHWAEKKLTGHSSDPLLDNLTFFFDSPEKVYGFSVKRDKVIHVSWMSGKRLYDHEPTSNETSELLTALRTYIESQQGVIQADPILNVRSLNENSYELMVAYPTDRNLTPNATFTVKNMIPGFLMVGEVRGGPKTIQLAEQNLDLYMRDHKLQSPAISFQTMITDRSKITDTSKWITRLNYPVFN
ncbi:MAG: hypothetical protein ACKO6Q_05220 [Bacteroidota bacterium]